MIATGIACTEIKRNLPLHWSWKQTLPIKVFHYRASHYEMNYKLPPSILKAYRSPVHLKCSTQEGKQNTRVHLVYTVLARKLGE